MAIHGGRPANAHLLANVTLCLLSAGLLACSDSGADGSSTGETSVGDGVETTEGDASSDETSESADTEGDSSSGSSSSESESESESESSASDEGGIKWDTLAPDLEPDCEAGSGDAESFIWIANSSQGSVSKIDTQAMVELGRYQARPDGGGSPSRTSVNTEGDMVVAARDGGVTKIWADEADCVESNGQPGIQTSVGNGQILAWDDEECRAWHTPLPYTNMRAIAWTTGEWDPETCTWNDAKIWATGNTASEGSVEVIRLDGETGELEATVAIPEAPLPIGHGGYGAAVDEDNNLWVAQVYANLLIKVDFETLEYETWNEPIHTYGMTYYEGNVYLCNRHVSRFDPQTEQFETALIEDWQGFYGHAGGCMVDGDGILWKTIDDTLYGVDTADLSIVDQIAMPEGMQWGVAVDFYGYVWTIPRNGTTAYRVDPDDHSIESIGGLVGAYTYSDMTGFVLQGVAAG